MRRGQLDTETRQTGSEPSLSTYAVYAVIAFVIVSVVAFIAEGWLQTPAPGPHEYTFAGHTWTLGTGPGNGIRLAAIIGVWAAIAVALRWYSRHVGYNRERVAAELGLSLTTGKPAEHALRAQLAPLQLKSGPGGGIRGGVLAGSWKGRKVRVWDAYRSSGEDTYRSTCVATQINGEPAFIEYAAPRSYTAARWPVVAWIKAPGDKRNATRYEVRADGPRIPPNLDARLIGLLLSYHETIAVRIVPGWVLCAMNDAHLQKYIAPKQRVYLPLPDGFPGFDGVSVGRYLLDLAVGVADLCEGGSLDHARTSGAYTIEWDTKQLAKLTTRRADPRTLEAHRL